MLLLLVAIGAQAADVTDMPPALRLDGGVSYVAAFESGHLREGTDDFGTRRASRHTLEYRVEFAPVDRFAVWLAVEHTVATRLAFEDPFTMGIDPATDGATYAGGSPTSDVTRKGSGLDGVWFGVAGAPFVETAAQRGPQTTWRLDAAFRTPDPQHTFWTTNGDQRGASPGGVGLLARAAFSVENHPADLWLVLQGLIETPAKVDGAKIDAADRADIRAGVELTAWRHADDGSDFGFEVLGGFGYAGYAKVPSGVLLPDVLDRTTGEVVSSAAYAHAHAGVGAYGHIYEWVALRAAFTTGWATPRRPEEPYPVLVGGDTLALGVQASVEGRWR